MIQVVLLVLVVGAYGKIYQRCELARELKYAYDVPEEEIATWVCIAEHESQYNTSAVGSFNADGSKDHGIFQISDKYWCSPPGKGWACGLSCADLEDDDIENDFKCVRRIYKEHKILSGDGFNAWAVYKNYCNDSYMKKYIEGCFNETEDTVTPQPKKPLTEKLYPWERPSSTSTIPTVPAKDVTVSTVAPLKCNIIEEKFGRITAPSIGCSFQTPSTTLSTPIQTSTQKPTATSSFFKRIINILPQVTTPTTTKEISDANPSKMPLTTLDDALAITPKTYVVYPEYIDVENFPNKNRERPSFTIKLRIWYL